MNLKKIRLNNHSKGDINVYANGSGSISKEFTERFSLGNKYVSFSIDKDDKEKKFLYLSVDDPGTDGNSLKLSKQKSGSFQVSFKRVQDEFDCRNKKMAFIYSRKINHESKPLFVFERVQ